MLKKVTIKNFRNIDHDVVLDNLKNTKENIVLYGVNNSSGKTNVIHAINKAIRFDGFVENDFSFDNPLSKQIKVSFDLDRLKFHESDYENFTLDVIVNKSNPYFPILKSNYTNVLQNSEHEGLVFATKKLFQINAPLNELNQLFVKYFLTDNYKLNPKKRSSLMFTNSQDKTESFVINALQEALENNSYAFFQLLDKLNESVFENKNNKYTPLNNYFLSKQASDLTFFELKEIEIEFIKLLSEVLEIYHRYKIEDEQTNIDKYALIQIQHIIKIIDKNEFTARTVNLVKIHNDWLEYFLAFFKLNKEKFYQLIIKSKDEKLEEAETLLLAKVLQKLKEMFLFYENSISDGALNIKDIYFDALVVNDERVIIARIINDTNSKVNLEELGRTFLEFTQLLSPLLFDDSNKIFMIDDFLDSYSKTSKDRVLTFIANNFRGKFIYTTSYLTDNERFLKNTDLVIIDEPEANLNTSKENVLLEKLAQDGGDSQLEAVATENMVSLKQLEEQELLNVELSNKLRLLVETLETKEEDVKNLEQQIAELKQNLLIANAHTQEHPKTDDTDMISVELHEEIVSLKDEQIEKLYARNEEERLRADELSTQLLDVQSNSDYSELEDAYNKLHAEDLDKAAKLTKISFEHELLRKEFREMKQSFIDLKNENNLNEVRFEKESLKLKTQLESSDDEYEDLYSKVQIFQVQIDKLSEINQDLIEKNKELELKNQKLELSIESESAAFEDNLNYNKSKIDLVENQNQKLEDRINELIEENEIQDEKIQTLNASVLQLNMLNEKIESSKVVLKNTLDNKIIVKDETIQEQEKTIDLLSQENEKHKEEIKDLSEQITQKDLDSASEISNLEKNESSLAKELRTLKKSLEDKTNKLEVSNSSNKELKSELSKAEKDLMKALLEIKSANTKYEDLNDKTSSTIDALETELDQLKEKHEKLEMDYSNESVRNDVREKEIHSLEEKLDKQVTKTEQNKEKHQEKLAEVKAKLVESDRDSRAKDQEIRAQLKIINANQREIEKKDALIAKHIENNDALKKDINDLNNNTKSLEKDLEARLNKTEDNLTKEQKNREKIEDLYHLETQQTAHLKDEIAKLKEQLSDQSEKTNTIKVSLDENVKRESELNSEIKEIEKQNNTLMRELEKSKNRLEKLTSTQEDLNTANKDLKEEIRSLKTNETKILRQSQQASKNNSILEEKNSILNDNLNETNNELKTAKKENNALDSKIQTLEIKVNDLQEQLQEVNKVAKKAPSVNASTKKLQDENAKLKKDLAASKTKVKTLSAKSATNTTKTVAPADYEAIKADNKAKANEIVVLKSQLNTKNVNTTKASKAQSDSLKRDKELMDLKINELTKRNRRLEAQLKERDDVLRRNNLYEGFEQSNYDKRRLIISQGDQSIAFIKWIVEKEKILLSEFEYEFVNLPIDTDAKKVKKIYQDLSKEEFDQLYFFANFDNKSKTLFATDDYKDLVKKYKVSQIKPYYWNLVRNTKAVVDKKITPAKEVKFLDSLLKWMEKNKFKVSANEPAKALNTLIKSLDKNEELYKQFIKDNSFDKLIKVLKSN